MFLTVELNEAFTNFSSYREKWILSTYLINSTQGLIWQVDQMLYHIQRADKNSRLKEMN